MGCCLVGPGLLSFPNKEANNAERDLEKGEAISPNSRTLKAVRRMLLDATNPVSPIIIIDDRRDSTEGADED